VGRGCWAAAERWVAAAEASRYGNQEGQEQLEEEEEEGVGHLGWLG
jgi:hypothetical protein